MSTKTELAGLIGEEMAEKPLQETEWLSEALMLKGITFKSVDDIPLENLSVDELKALWVEIEQLLKKRRSEGKKIILTYDPERAEKSAVYVHPLARNCSEGIEAIARGWCGSSPPLAIM